MHSDAPSHVPFPFQNIFILKTTDHSKFAIQLLYLKGILLFPVSKCIKCHIFALDFQGGLGIFVKILEEKNTTEKLSFMFSRDLEKELEVCNGVLITEAQEQT